MEKVILCYGDSNTWGYIPNKDFLITQRYPRNQRWPGILQELLGKEYHIIEEGLNGRTTNLNWPIPPDRNGKTYLPTCLYSHSPIDLVILALGGNDFKKYFNRKIEHIRDGLSELIDIVQQSTYGPRMIKSPEILIINPPKPLKIAEEFIDENGNYIFNGSIAKADLLTQLYADLAKEKKCYYLDISQLVFPSSIDGLHFDLIGHDKIANLIFEKINKITNERGNAE